MSNTIEIEATSITVTSYAAGKGQTAYQVTWRSTDKEHMFDYVCFKSEDDAYKFVDLLKVRI